MARLAERLASFDRTITENEQRLAELAATIEVAAGEHERLRVELEQVSAAEREASELGRQTEEGAREATERAHGLKARAEALQAALDETRARAGVERLAGLRGVLGTLADLVAVEDGCEKAFEAAVEDALGTVVVDGTDTAREALRHLHDAGLHGGVLPTSSFGELASAAFGPSSLDGG